MAATLVLGGARSGKSAYAEQLATKLCDKPVYLATAQAGDDEMARRIADHKARRGRTWHLIEVPVEIAPVVAATLPGTAVVVDCLTLWLANLMEAERDVARLTDELVQALGRAGGDVIMVANEVGLSIVPDNAMARRFRDEAGRLNQHVAEAADDVVFMAAGLPMVLKRGGRTVHE